MSKINQLKKFLDADGSLSEFVLLHVIEILAMKVSSEEGERNLKVKNL